jgi:hypothetical protein
MQRGLVIHTCVFVVFLVHQHMVVMINLQHLKVTSSSHPHSFIMIKVLRTTNLKLSTIKAYFYGECSRTTIQEAYIIEFLHHYLTTFNIGLKKCFIKYTKNDTFACMVEHNQDVRLMFIGSDFKVMNWYWLFCRYCYRKSRILVEIICLCRWLNTNE